MELLELPKMAADDQKELEVYVKKSASVVDEALRLVETVDSPEGAEAAGRWCAGQLEWCDRIENSYLGRVRDYFFRGHKEAVAEIDKYVVPVRGKPGQKGDTGGAVGIVREKIRQWREKDRQRIEYEQAKANALAKKKDEDDRIAAAIKAEAAGHKPIADAILSGAGNYVPPMIPVVKYKSHSGRMVWHIAIDPAKKGELLKMIAERPEFYSFVQFDETRMLEYVRSVDGNIIPAWPGVSCAKKERLTFR